MSNPNLLLPAVFLAAFALSLAFVPLARRLSFRLGKVYYPRADRWHKKPTPTLGGTAMFTAFIVAVLAATWTGGQAGQMKWSLLVAGGMMFGLGFVDDLKPVTPQTKLLL